MRCWGIAETDCSCTVGAGPTPGRACMVNRTPSTAAPVKGPAAQLPVPAHWMRQRRFAPERDRHPIPGVRGADRSRRISMLAADPKLWFDSAMVSERTLVALVSFKRTCRFEALRFARTNGSVMLSSCPFPVLISITFVPPSSAAVIVVALPLPDECQWDNVVVPPSGVE